MSKRQCGRLSSTGLALAIALSMSQSASSTTFQTAPRLDVIEWPNREFRTIQSAIDALPDGGTLRFAAGVVTTEPLFVRGKRIVIEGAGSGCDEQRQPGKPTQTASTHLVGPRADTVVEFGAVRGLINYTNAGPGTPVGGGTIRNLRLSGSDAGIRGAADADAGAGGGVVAEGLCITHAGRGIAWGVGSNLSLKNVLIQDVFWNGVSISTEPRACDGILHLLRRRHRDKRCERVRLLQGRAGGGDEQPVQLLRDERNDRGVELQPLHLGYEHHRLPRARDRDVRRQRVHSRDLHQ